MTKSELAEIIRIHDRLEVLEHEGRFEEADKFFFENRWAFDYDSEGDWIGAVANENGWTP